MMTGFTRHKAHDMINIPEVPPHRRQPRPMPTPTQRMFSLCVRGVPCQVFYVGSHGFDLPPVDLPAKPASETAEFPPREASHLRERKILVPPNCSPHGKAPHLGEGTILAPGGPDFGAYSWSGLVGDTGTNECIGALGEAYGTAFACSPGFSPKPRSFTLPTLRVGLGSGSITAPFLPHRRWAGSGTIWKGSIKSKSRGKPLR